jgi:hypothetical protein
MDHVCDNICYHGIGTINDTKKRMYRVLLSCISECEDSENFLELWEIEMKNIHCSVKSSYLVRCIIMAVEKYDITESRPD